MARGKALHKRIMPTPDPVYQDLMVAKLINKIMIDGKKTIAQKLVYDAFEKIKAQGLDPVETLNRAIDTVGPKVEVRAKRIGGAAYQVPTEVRGERRVALAIRWMLDAARKRPNKEFRSFSDKLASELLDASKNTGESIRKRDIAQKMAEANRAFAHFRF